LLRATTPDGDLVQRVQVNPAAKAKTAPPAPCREGYRRNARGACVAIYPPAPPSCREGQRERCARRVRRYLSAISAALPGGVAGRCARRVRRYLPASSTALPRGVPERCARRVRRRLPAISAALPGRLSERCPRRVRRCLPPTTYRPQERCAANCYRDALRRDDEARLRRAQERRTTNHIATPYVEPPVKRSSFGGPPAAQPPPPNVSCDATSGCSSSDNNLSDQACSHSNSTGNPTDRYATNELQPKNFARVAHDRSLSAGIRSLLWNSQRRGPESAGRGTCHPGRDHPGMVGDIISERWAELSRNGWAASFRNHGRLAPESASPHWG
jgi:hypothetical protein